MHRPAGFTARGEVRDQFVHAVDLAPTVLDLVGIGAPEQVDGVVQQRWDGASIRATLHDADAPNPRDVQYFEMLGSRSIYADGWKATTDHVSKGVVDEERLLQGSRDFAADRWSLFDLEHDFAEAHDVADEHPELVRELEARWTAEAEVNQVFPLVDDLIQRITVMLPPPNPPQPRGLPTGRGTGARRLGAAHVHGRGDHGAGHRAGRGCRGCAVRHG